MLFSLETMDVLMVSGRDRVRFLHAMLSGDVSALTEGHGLWATLNTVKGHTLADVRLLALDTDRKEGSMLALLEKGAGSLFVESLDRFVIAEKVYFEPAEDTALWLLAGDGCDATLSAAGASLPAESLLCHVQTELGGAPLRVVRFDRSGPEAGDLLLVFRNTDEAAILGALEGAPRGETSLLEARRIESGQPRFGIDFTAANIPLECGLADRAIDFEKGCYPGQEVICRINALGAPARRLVRMAIAEDTAPEPGSLLFRDGKEVGYITSSVRSNRRGTGVAMGYLGKRHCAEGTVLTVGDAGGELTAQAQSTV